MALKAMLVPAAAAVAAASMVLLADRAEIALAEKNPTAATKIGQFNASGLMFKDVVEVTAFRDPKIQGVTIHVSNVKRALTDRLSKDFFADPSQTSVAASQTGPLKLLSPIAFGPEGEEVFSVKKNLFFKALHVRRIYDEPNDTLVYVAYSTRINQDMSEQNSRYKTSVSTISLYGQNFNARALEGGSSNQVTNYAFF